MMGSSALMRTKRTPDGAGEVSRRQKCSKWVRAFHKKMNRQSHTLSITKLKPCRIMCRQQLD